MASNMYLKFENPSISSISSGEHAGELEILNWNHEFTRGSASNLTVARYMDGSSQELMRHAWQGKQIGKATITCYRSDGASDKPVVYLTIVMQPVFLANFSVTGGGGGDKPVETFPIEYGTIEYHYNQQKRDDGQLLKAAAPFQITKTKPAAAKKKSASKKKK